MSSRRVVPYTITSSFGTVSVPGVSRPNIWFFSLVPLLAHVSSQRPPHVAVDIAVDMRLTVAFAHIKESAPSATFEVSGTDGTAFLCIVWFQEH